MRAHSVTAEGTSDGASTLHRACGRRKDPRIGLVCVAALLSSAVLTDCGDAAAAAAADMTAARAAARRAVFESTVSVVREGVPTARELTFCMDGQGSSGAFLDVAGVEGPECAATALGAAAAAVASPLFIGGIVQGESFNISVRWGESPGAAVRAAVEARARGGRVMRPYCAFWGRERTESVALCSLPPDEERLGARIAADDLRPFGFMPRAGVAFDGGRWPALHGDAASVNVCSTFSASSSRGSIAAFVAHAVGAIGARHVYLYDVEDDVAGASAAAVHDAVPPAHRRHVTILRLPRGLRSRTDALRACTFSSGHDAAWVLYIEPSERIVLPASAPTLGALVSSPVFQAADAIMLRACGICGARSSGRTEVDHRVRGCMLGRPLLRFGRVSVAGVRSSCAASPSFSVTAAGRNASIDHAACGDTHGDVDGSACDDDSCTDVSAHICITAESPGLRVGAANWSAACAAVAVPRFERLAALGSALAPAARGGGRLERAWKARPKTRAPRLAYATLAYGDVDAVLPRLAFALANWRDVSPADRVALVPQGTDWASRADVSAAAAAADASLIWMPSVLPPARCSLEVDPLLVAEAAASGRPVGYFSGTYLLVHAFALAAYDSVVYIDAGDTLANSGVDAPLAAFASGNSEWGGRSDTEPPCLDDEIFDVNAGIMFLRPSRALYAHILAEHAGNKAIRCLFAVQDTLNDVLWAAFGHEGLRCMSTKEHCSVSLREDCDPLRAHLVQFAGLEKPWHPRSWRDSPYSVARAAEYNARFSDWRRGSKAPCWPGGTCALLAVRLSAEARAVLGESVVQDSYVLAVPCTLDLFSIDCHDIDCCLPRSENGTVNNGIAFVYYSVAASVEIVVSALLNSVDVLRGVYGGVMDVERSEAGALVAQWRGGDSHRIVIAVDPASHITAQLVAASVGRSTLLVSATPRQALEWAAESAWGAAQSPTCLIVASGARLRPLCQGFTHNGSDSGASVRRPAIWLPSESATNDAAALAAALSPCASALWAAEPVVPTASCDSGTPRDGHPGACARAARRVRVIPLVASSSLIARIRRDERAASVALLAENAISGATCNALAAAAGGDDRIACWDVGDAMSGKAPTAAELIAFAQRARAVIVSYDAIACEEGGGALGARRLTGVAPSIVALSVAGVRVVAWCVSTLYRRDAGVCCGITVPPSVVIVDSAAEAFAAAEMIAKDGLDDPAQSESVSAMALSWWSAPMSQEHQ